MIASYHLPGASGRAISVTNSVTNRLGNRGHSRAMKSLLLGNPGQWRGTEGNLSFGLRSKVQILPPQPTHSTIVNFIILQKTRTALIRSRVRYLFFRIRLVTAHWVCSERERKAQIVHPEMDPNGSIAVCHQYCHQLDRLCHQLDRRRHS